LWNSQCVLRYGAQGGTALHQGNADPAWAEFADYLLEIAAAYPQADTIHLVLDNLSTHTRKAVADRFGKAAGNWIWNRFTLHYIPKHGSWSNQAEMEISLFSRQCLGRRRIDSITELRRQAPPGTEG
jgi:transposase